jgi:hypothetical protein
MAVMLQRKLTPPQATFAAGGPVTAAARGILLLGDRALPASSSLRAAILSPPEHYQLHLRAH